MVSKAKELATRVEDLEHALRTVGQILHSGTEPHRTRIDQVMGVLKMYGCEPKTTTAATDA